MATVATTPPARFATPTALSVTSPRETAVVTALPTPLPTPGLGICVAASAPALVGSPVLVSASTTAKEPSTAASARKKVTGLLMVKPKTATSAAHFSHANVFPNDRGARSPGEKDWSVVAVANRDAIAAA